MILCIQNVLAPDILGEVNAALEAAAFVEGRVTASEHAKLVKNNLQIDERSTCHAELSKTLSCAVLANGLFQLAVWPRTLFPFRVSRYDAGMGYGEHVDDPLFQGNRSDVSMTVFLSDPESYEGGELVIQWGGSKKSSSLLVTWWSIPRRHCTACKL